MLLCVDKAISRCFEWVVFKITRRNIRRLGRMLILKREKERERKKDGLNRLKRIYTCTRIYNVFSEELLQRLTGGG